MGRLRRWAFAVIGREPMSVNEALVLIATGGGVVLGLFLSGLVPDATDALPLWVLWLLVVTASALLMIRGAWSLLGSGRDAARGAAAWVGDRLPFEVRSPVTRKPRTLSTPAALGILDWELAFERAGKRMKQSLEEVARAMTGVTAEIQRYSPRFKEAASLTAKRKVDLSRSFARRVRPHAGRMHRAESGVRAHVTGFSDNWLKRIKAFPPELDLGQMRPSVSSLHQTTTETLASIRNYRSAVQGARNINLQQAMNEVLDQLLVTADNIIRDVEASVDMADQALTEIDGRPSTKGVSRAERRRRRQGRS